MNGRQRGARLGVERCKWKTEGSEIGRGAVWMGVRMEDGGEREGVRRGVDGGKGGSCGWTEAVYKACFRVSLKHASLWAEIFRKLKLNGVSLKHASLWAQKLRLKGLQMRWR